MYVECVPKFVSVRLGPLFSLLMELLYLRSVMFME